MQQQETLVEHARIESAGYRIVPLEGMAETAVISSLALYRISKEELYAAALGRHLKRLRQHFEDRFDTPFPLEQDVLQQQVEFASIRLLREHCGDQQQLRLRLIASPCAVTASFSRYQNPWKMMPGGIRLHSYRGLRCQPALKLLNDSQSLAARAHARSSGADEALLLDAAEHVAEGAWSNFFWVDQAGALRSPQRQLLEGVTRALVLAQYECILADLPLSEIKAQAREAFVSQGTSGITAVAAIDGHALPHSPGPLTREIQQWYYQHIQSAEHRLGYRT